MGINIDATRRVTPVQVLNIRRSGLPRRLYMLATSPSSLRDWLTQLALTAQPWLDQGYGIIACAVRGDPGVALEELVVLGAADGEKRALGLSRSIADTFSMNYSGLAGTDVLVLSECQAPFARKLLQAQHDLPPESRIADYIVVHVASGRQPSSRRVFLIVPCRDRCRLNSWQRKALVELAAHLQSALTLRLLACPERPNAPSSADAECALVQLRRTKGCERVTPERARELWHELLGGHWSLLAHHEAAGVRFVLARRDDPRAPLALTLTRRESCAAALAVHGHSTKYIAYELGVAVSTASVLVASAIQKLGIRSRVELVEMFGAVPTPATLAGRPTRFITADCFAVESNFYALFEISLRRLEPPRCLTVAEREVVLGVLSRKSNAEIACDRRTSKNTVANQLRAVYVKLGISGRFQLIASC